MGFGDDMAAVDAMFDEMFGVSIKYLVGGASIATPTATVALQNYDIERGDGVILSVELRDYTLRKADLAGHEPTRGDRIQEVVGGELQTFEVLPLGDEPCWQPVDADARRILIHTKRIAAE